MSSTSKPRINWLVDRNELWLGNKLIKHFDISNSDQAKLLSSFQELNWAEFIPTPFRGSKAKRASKLGNAVKSLNQAIGNPKVFRFDIIVEDGQSFISYKASGGRRRVSGNLKKPYWDAYFGELFWKGNLIKHYRWLSPNIAWVLSEFQKRGWPTKIDDPLPPSDVDPKARIHDTIKCLNRGLKNKHVRFRGDGKGEGVLWEKA